MTEPDIRSNDREIDRNVELCDASGRLNEKSVGWSGIPFLKSVQLESLFRRQRWNIWKIHTDELTFDLSVVDIGYAGMVIVTLDRRLPKKNPVQAAVCSVMRKVSLSEGVIGVSSFQNENIDLEMINDSAGYSISLSWSRFSDNKDLSVEIFMPRKKVDESVNFVRSFNRKRFHSLSVHHLYNAKGFLSLGQARHEMNGSHFYSTLEVGRGVWPHLSRWNSVTLGGKINRDTVGIRLDFTDGLHTGPVNGWLLLNGNLIRINPFTFSRNGETIHLNGGNSGELSFSADTENRIEKGMIVVAGKIRRTFGYFSGVIRTGKKDIPIKKFPGWIDDYHLRW
jgi:hypothetical protein